MIVTYTPGSTDGAGLMYGRAFGGRVVHRLREDDWSSVALCGYEPRSFLHWRSRAAAVSDFPEALCRECAKVAAE